ncbi:hypothetical protein ACH427_14415 [Streptomyces sp. NPDC020379]|uniref:hypothetical protein n=1 Tax=Streptomyces sp. NPDC020379 TaxID=3365071 RepID=UPI0037A89B0C
MSGQPGHHHDGPLIPMPELTLPALRRAIATVAPGQLPELFDEMQTAFDRASEHDSIGPIRLFFRRWGTVVAIERDPARAARFHAAEERMRTSGDAAERQEAIHEIGTIIRAAQREVEDLEAG